jgi:hypothetical protein
MPAFNREGTLMAEKRDEGRGTRGEATATAATAAPAVKADEEFRRRADEEFRRRAALAILGGSRHHIGHTRPEYLANLRIIWQIADAFLELEHEAPLPPPPPPEEIPGFKKARRAHPSDEWAVREEDGQRLRRGFVTYQEAMLYVQNHPGSQIVQLSGPDVDRIAPSSVPATPTPVIATEKELP